MTTHNKCYQNGKEQPAIFVILGRSNHHHHTLLTSMSTHPDSPATVIRTTSDVNFKQAQHIYAVAAWIIDAVGILEELCSTIGDHTSSHNKTISPYSNYHIQIYLNARAMV